MPSAKCKCSRCAWEQAFWDVARALKCLPSSAPRDNQHVVRTAQQLWIDPRRSALPSAYVNSAGILASDSPAVTVQKLDAAFRAMHRGGKHA